MIPSPPVPHGKHRRLCALLLLASAFQAGPAVSTAQTPEGPGGAYTAGTPTSWAEAAAANELRIIQEDGTFPARYLVRKVDARGDTTRDTIESRDGVVARLVARDGEPLTAQEDAAERQRLEAVLASPSEFARHHKRSTDSRGYASDLVRLMPRAMLYSYTPGQPQPAGSTSPQVVLDFKPDPGFRPPSMVAGLLTGIAGRVWIDARTHTLTRGETRVVQPVDFGWGMLARIYPGGTVTFEQKSLGDGHWLYTYVEDHVRIREMLVKTAVENATMRVSDVRILPAALSYQEAIRTLLDTPSRSTH